MRKKVFAYPLILRGEPMEDSFFKFAEPELNFYGNEAIDVGHVAGGKNDP